MITIPAQPIEDQLEAEIIAVIIKNLAQTEMTIFDIRKVVEEVRDRITLSEVGYQFA